MNHFFQCNCKKSWPAIVTLTSYFYLIDPINLYGLIDIGINVFRLIQKY